MLLSTGNVWLQGSRTLLLYPAGTVQSALALRHIIRWRHPKLMTSAHHAVDAPVVYEVGLAGAGSDGFLRVYSWSWLLASSLTALLHVVVGLIALQGGSVVVRRCLFA